MLYSLQCKEWSYKDIVKLHGNAFGLIHYQVFFVDTVKLVCMNASW